MAQFGFHSTAEEVSQGIDLKGKVVIVTGGSSGLGQESSRVFALRGAHVILAVRDVKKGQVVADEIKLSTGNSQVEVLQLELSSFASIRTFAQAFKDKGLPLHVLLNNAGIMAVPFQLISGYESQFATNHLGHFLLTNLLAPILVASAPSRVVCLSSVGHRRSPIRFDDINFEKEGYQKWTAYGQSKTANILFAKELQKRLGPKGVTAFSLHPGGIMTGLQSSLSKEEMTAMGWLDENGNPRGGFKTIPQGSATSVYASIVPGLESIGGAYLEDCAECVKPAYQTADQIGGVAAHANDLEAAARLWELSEKAVQSY